MISHKLLEEIWKCRARGQRLYELAERAQVDRSTFSALINRVIVARPGDRRVVRIGAVVGLAPEDCFEVDIRPRNPPKPVQSQEDS